MLKPGFGHRLYALDSSRGPYYFAIIADVIAGSDGRNRVVVI